MRNGEHTISKRLELAATGLTATASRFGP